MINKELLLMGGEDSEATVVLRITHGAGDAPAVTMDFNLREEPWTSFALLPPIPLHETVEYTVKVRKGASIGIYGGTNDLAITKVTPSDAAEHTGSTHINPIRILDSCIIEGYTTTY